MFVFIISVHKDIHVIGDACKAGKMPKSGYAANSQGKVCAKAVVAHLNGNNVDKLIETSPFFFTCSLLE